MRIRWLFQNILLLLYCKYQYSEYNGDILYLIISIVIYKYERFV